MGRDRREKRGKKSYKSRIKHNLLQLIQEILAKNGNSYLPPFLIQMPGVFLQTVCQISTQGGLSDSALWIYNCKLQINSFNSTTLDCPKIQLYTSVTISKFSADQHEFTRHIQHHRIRLILISSSTSKGHLKKTSKLLQVSGKVYLPYYKLHATWETSSA